MSMKPYLPWTEAQIVLALRAVRVVVAAGGSFGDTERALLNAAARALGAAGSAGELEPITPAEIAVELSDAVARRRLIEMLSAVAATGGGAAAITSVSGFAEALRIDGEWLDQARRDAERRIERMRSDAGRRIPHAALAAHGMRDAGRAGPWKLFRDVVRGGADPELAWRHKELGLLPRGTLGREYWAEMTARGFLLPGERGAISADEGCHDFVRVLCGYEADAAGEAEVAAFTAGVARREDPFAFVFAALLMGQLAEALGSAKGPSAAPVAIDSERIQRAFQRGLSAGGDLSEAWDYWPVVGLPIEEIRQRYGIGTA